MKHVVILGLLAAAATLPLQAGTVYVPYATDEMVGSAHYRTEVAVTNPGDSPARVQMLFVSADGVRLPGRTATVPAHGTSIVPGIAPAGAHGRVEVSGPAALVVSARLNAYGQDGLLLSSAVEPLVSAENLVPAGQPIHLQGLANSADAVTRWGALTIDEQGSCSFAAFSSDGAELGATSRAAATALSRDFAEPLQALRAGALAEARLEVTCDAPAFAYAAVLSNDGSRTTFVAPSTSLQADLTPIVDAIRAGGVGGDGGENSGGKGSGSPSSPVGGTPPASPGETPLGVPVALDNNGSFKIDGDFFFPVDGDSYRQYVLNLLPNVKYHRVTVDFDLFINRWQTSIFQAVAGLRRTGKTLFWGMLIRVDKQKTLIDAGHDKLYKGIAKWQQKSNYHVQVVYDTAARKVTLQVLDGNGNVFQTITGKTTNNDLRLTKAVYVDLGLRGIADHAYFPPSTWKYSNLKVVAIP
ncbi:MAG TPA: hypothetical protein VIH93_14285 [Thermoanaerobaculia bacterium]